MMARDVCQLYADPSVFGCVRKVRLSLLEVPKLRCATGPPALSDATVVTAKVSRKAIWRPAATHPIACELK
jgi:hypothetical protein